MLDKRKKVAITLDNKKKEKPEHRFGDLLTAFYEDLSNGNGKFRGISVRSDLAYITSLLNSKFNKNYSFQEVNKLLKECLGVAIDG